MYSLNARVSPLASLRRSIIWRDLVFHDRSSACESSEHGVAGLPGERRIVVEEQTDDVAGGEQALDRLVDRVEHLGVAIDLDAAEGECNPASHRQRAERRLVDAVRPVRLRDRESARRLAVRPPWVERLV